MAFGFALGLSLAGLLSAPASGYVTIGTTHVPDPNTSQAVSWPSPSVLFNVGAPADTPLLASSSGVITRWRLYTGDVTAGSTLQLRVILPEGGDNYRMIASGAVETLPQSLGQSNLQSFTSNLPIIAGQGVGVIKTHPGGGFLEVTVPQSVPAPSPWRWGSISPPPVDGASGGAAIFDNPGPGGVDGFLAFSADIEPDADGDRFGDETQDLCPTDAARRGPCPAPTDPRGPAVALAGVRSSMTFAAFLRGVRAIVTPSEPAAFESDLLARANRARISAFNLTLASKSLRLGSGRRTMILKPRRSLVRGAGKRFKVRLRIRATDAAKNATVVTKTIRVKRRRRR